MLLLSSVKGYTDGRETIGRYTMSKIERMRDALASPPEPGYWEQRSSAGWRLAFVEWEREASGEEEPTYKEELPYGLRVAGDCRHLEEDPIEMQALTLMMNSIVDDQPLSVVADELNRRGLLPRSGTPWTRTSVFQMLPRLIEAGPQIFSKKEWRDRKRSLLRAL